MTALPGDFVGPDLGSEPYVHELPPPVRSELARLLAAIAQGVAGVPPLTDAQREVLALYEATANDPALYLDMDFQPGDVQWLRNCFVLHKRTAYEDHAEPERKRHLLRLWLAIDRLADGTPRFPVEGGAPR